jgi:hypothetical protein
MEDNVKDMVLSVLNPKLLAGLVGGAERDIQL